VRPLRAQLFESEALTQGPSSGATTDAAGRKENARMSPGVEMRLSLQGANGTRSFDRVPHHCQ
jgi:hypothetical protein